jgi:hypothetical protein
MVERLWKWLWVKQRNGDDVGKAIVIVWSSRDGFGLASEHQNVFKIFKKVQNDGELMGHIM